MSGTLDYTNINSSDLIRLVSDMHVGCLWLNQLLKNYYIIVVKCKYYLLCHSTSIYMCVCVCAGGAPTVSSVSAASGAPPPRPPAAETFQLPLRTEPGSHSQGKCVCLQGHTNCLPFLLGTKCGLGVGVTNSQV